MTRADGGPVRRVRIDRDLDPLDVLARFRHRDRPVALLGDWHHGDALVAFDPVRVADDPFADVVLDPVDVPGGFGGGWIGVWGYRLGQRLEHVGEPAVRPVPQPDHRLGFYDRVLRRSAGTWWLETLGRDDDAEVLAALDDPPQPATHRVGAFGLTPDGAAHREAVRRAVEHVHAGDIFQVNLCARLEAPFEGDPVALFAAGVRALRPAYAAFVGSPEGAVASLSPELFLRRTGREVLTSPIKGTAPLTTDPQLLLGSGKDRAENVMIVDLMRNDLGRVASPGTVRVPALVRAERHAVWHLVSDVVARLGPDVDDADLLRATFPPGSVTGAPKVRAMQVAADLEATARETYTGAIGHVSPAAGLELNVAIRTFEIADGRVWLGVGGGVVADSTPDGELAECFVKAAPLVEAVGGTLAEPAPAVTVAAPSAPTPPPAATDAARGVFTTVLVEDGHAVDLDAHLARLDASVRALHGRTVRPGLEDAVRRKVAGTTGRLRLRVDAVPGADGVAVTLTLSDLPDAASSWRLEPRVVPGGWGAHKWADRDPLAPGQADDVLVLDADGAVLETGRASLFVVHDDGVHTPALDGRLLPGTMRARVVDDLAARGIPVHQRTLVTADLASASEVFATNALRGVVPVHAVDGIGSWPEGPVTRLLRRGPAPERSPRPRVPGRPRVLFVDNYDSFVFNLVQYVRELGAETTVVRNDEATVDELAAGGFTHVVLSPGPGAPADAGISIDLVRRLGPTTPVLGVCLGHQAIAEAYGARVVRADEVVHGKPSLVHHDGRGVHAGLPTPLVVARYHSLVADETTLPPELEVTSRTASGVVMGLRHRTHPVEGVQWHPESILTSHGHDLLATFLAGDVSRRAGRGR
ncbi:MAG: aminodeoxychorismate synthase component I [Aeromicrobium erythreum]